MQKCFRISSRSKYMRTCPPLQKSKQNLMNSNTKSLSRSWTIVKMSKTLTYLLKSFKSIITRRTESFWSRISYSTGKSTTWWRLICAELQLSSISLSRMWVRWLMSYFLMNTTRWNKTQPLPSLSLTRKIVTGSISANSPSLSSSILKK